MNQSINAGTSLSPLCHLTYEINSTEMSDSHQESN